MSRWVRIARKEAIKGRHHQHWVGAVVVRGGRLISKAANLSRPFGKDNCGFHAEERALGKRRDVAGGTIVVVRLNAKSGRNGLSKPCDKCMKVIRDKGIKKICYLDDNNEFVVEKV